jgi:hypothetical protein
MLNGLLAHYHGAGADQTQIASPFRSQSENHELEAGFEDFAQAESSQTRLIVTFSLPTDYLVSLLQFHVIIIRYFVLT